MGLPPGPGGPRLSAVRSQEQLRGTWQRYVSSRSFLCICAPASEFIETKKSKWNMKPAGSGVPRSPVALAARHGRGAATDPGRHGVTARLSGSGLTDAFSLFPLIWAARGFSETITLSCRLFRGLWVWDRCGRGHGVSAFWIGPWQGPNPPRFMAGWKSWWQWRYRVSGKCASPDLGGSVLSERCVLSSWPWGRPEPRRRELGAFPRGPWSHPAYLPYMQSASWETLGWKKHKLESRLLGEISITSDMHLRWHYPYGRK